MRVKKKKMFILNTQRRDACSAAFVRLRGLKLQCERAAHFTDTKWYEVANREACSTRLALSKSFGVFRFS